MLEEIDYVSAHVKESRRTGISNLRFADDVMLLASTKNHLKKMLTEFESSTETRVSKIHPDKTKVLTHNRSNKQREIEVTGTKIEILPREGKVRYLGQVIYFKDQESNEIQHRIRCAWSAFAKHRQELTSNSKQ